MLHKPVVLKLEEPRVTGKLSQHCRHVLMTSTIGLKYTCATHSGTQRFGFVEAGSSYFLEPEMAKMAGSISFATRPRNI